MGTIVSKHLIQAKKSTWGPKSNVTELRELYSVQLVWLQVYMLDRDRSLLHIMQARRALFKEKAL